MDLTFARRYIGTANYIAVGTWLTILYVFSILSVLFSLCIHQFKHEIEKVNIESSAAIDITTSVFMDHQCDVSKITELKFESVLVKIPCIQQPKAQEIGAMSAFEILRNHSQEVEHQKREIERSKKQLQVFTDELNGLEEEVGPISPKMRIIEGNIKRAGKKLSVQRNELAEIEGQQSKLMAFQNDSDFYNKLFSFILNRAGLKNIWDIPETLLSIILALSMGGLGSLITVTVEYLRIEKKSYNETRFSEYFFRPILGSVMALVVYIAIKSGQLSIMGGEVTELTPFLLSFIGILSGLMSEQVYKKLIAYGDNVIPGEHA